MAVRAHEPVSVVELLEVLQSDTEVLDGVSVRVYTRVMPRRQPIAAATSSDSRLGEWKHPLMDNARSLLAAPTDELKVVIEQVRHLFADGVAIAG